MSTYHTEIRVKGNINPKWSDWFGEMHLQESTCGETILAGKLPDMAAVYGVISRLGSLVIPLVSVKCIEKSDLDLQNESASDPSTQPYHRFGY